MKFVLTCLLIFGLGFWGPLYAHTPLLSTVPVDGASVETPTALSLEFKDKVRLAKLTLVRPDGETTKVDLSANKHFLPLHQVPVTGALSAGDYQVRWRALAEDGHVLKGMFSFTVQ